MEQNVLVSIGTGKRAETKGKHRGNGKIWERKQTEWTSNESG